MKQSSAIRSKCLTLQHYAHSHVANRGPTRILFLLLVVDENWYARGRKWTCPWTKKDIIAAGRGRKRIWPFSSWRVGDETWTKTDMPLNMCVATLPYFTSTLYSARNTSTEHRAVPQDAIKWPVITRARPNRSTPLAFFAHSSLVDITYYKRQGYGKITALDNVMKLSVTQFSSNTYIFDHCTILYFGRKKRSP